MLEAGPLPVYACPEAVSNPHCTEPKSDDGCCVENNGSDNPDPNPRGQRDARKQTSKCAECEPHYPLPSQDGPVVVSHTRLPNGLQLSGRRKPVRCSRGLGPALTSLSDLEKLGVIPDVLVILGQKEPPAGRKAQIRKHGRQQFGNMRDMMRLKEIRV